MKKKKQITALIMTVAIIFVMLFSALFITVEAGHNCTDNHCPICTQINICINTIKGFALATMAFALAAMMKFLACDIILFIKNAFTQSSLVTLKVKLSN